MDAATCTHATWANLPVLSCQQLWQGPGCQVCSHAYCPAILLDMLCGNQILTDPVLPLLQDTVGSMGSKVSVVKLPKSGGVAQRQTQARQSARNERISEYFHGPDRMLHPITLNMEPEKLRVFRLGERSAKRLVWGNIVSAGDDRCCSALHAPQGPSHLSC
jgi:hypothetical protein